MRSDFVKPLLLWYNENARDLPWRRTKDPYRIWVSEIMLQQTRVEAVRGYYERFITALPTIEALAACPEDALLKLWEGLGYYSRVRNMQKAAREIVKSYEGRMPKGADDLRTLPGIGDYTAGAISSIAFGMAEPAVDGNVLRVIARLEAMHDNILSESFKKRMREELRTLHSENDGTFGILNQAFMDLGATVCLAGAAPLCTECPVQPCCRAHAEDLQQELPVREKKQKRKALDLTVFLLMAGEACAIRKRPDPGLLGGLYEFPNVPGKLGENEALSAVEAWGFSPLRIWKLADAKHIFSHVEWHMAGYKILIAPPEFNNAGLMPCGWEGEPSPKSPGRRVALEIGEQNAKAPGMEASPQMSEPSPKATGMGDALEIGAWKTEGVSSDFIFAEAEVIERDYPVPSAFEKYANELNIRTGKQRRNR